MWMRGRAGCDGSPEVAGIGRDRKGDRVKDGGFTPRPSHRVARLRDRLDLQGQQSSAVILAHDW